MISRLVYGKHKEYGDWLEKIFRIVHRDSRRIVASYQKTQVAKEAMEDREYIEERAIRWFILALYGFYFFKVLERKDYAEIREGDEDLIAQRAGTFFKAMNMGFGGNDTATNLCMNFIQRWNQSAGGLIPEYVAAENLANHFDFSIGSGRDEIAFKEANTRFFQAVKGKRITPALHEFLGEGDPDVKHVLELGTQGYDGYHQRGNLDDSLPDWLKSKSNN